MPKQIMIWTEPGLEKTESCSPKNQWRY